MKSRRNRKGMELPINIVITVIIGIIIFGLGFSLFSQISSESDKRIEDLNNQVRTGIAVLECENSVSAICAPSYSMRNGQERTFQVFVTNHDDLADEFSIRLPSTLVPNPRGGVILESNNDCGSVIIFAPNININIPAKESASFPISVMASRVARTPCSFVTTVEETRTNEKTPLIIRVE